MVVLRSRLLPSARAFLFSPRLWLTLILLLAWGLRLFHLGAMSIWWDESLSYDRALQDISTILSGTIRIQSVLTHDLHPPLYFLLLHFAVLAFGVTEFALRTISTFANILTVALIYPTCLLVARVGRLQKANRIALSAAFFAALSPFYVWYSQEARPYSLVLLWSLLALYALLRAVMTSAGEPEKENPHLLRRRYFWTAFFLAALGTTLFTHYLSFILLPFHAAVVAIFGRRRREWQVLALCLLGAFALIFVLLPGGAAGLTGSDSGGASFVPLFIMLRDVLNSFAVGVTANLDRVALVDLALVGLWCLGVASTARPPRRDYRLALFSLAFLFLPALALQAGSYIRPLYLNSRHLITASPAFYLGLALGVNAIAGRAENSNPLPRVALIGAAAGAAMLVIFSAYYALNNLYFDSTYAKDDHRAWSDYLRERDRAGDLLILDAPQAEKIYEYYAPPGLQWISLPNIGTTQSDQERLDFRAVVDGFRSHDRIWLLEIHRPVADPANHIWDLVNRFGTFVSTTYFPGTSTQLVLSELDREPPISAKAPDIRNLLFASFGDNLEFLGYDAPPQIAAGARGTVKLYWRLKKPSGEDYGVSLRLIDDAGNRWAQWDAPPVGNLWPVSHWPAEDIVLDQHDLPVAPGTPPGTYHLAVGAYRSANQDALPVSGGQETLIRLTDVLVTRPPSPLNPDNLVMDHHAGATFGGQVKLLGYDSGDGPVHPGDLFPLTLYFQLLANPGHDLSGQVKLAAPFYAVWNSASAVAPFTLALTGRSPGDIVQTDVQLRVPGDAGGELSLQLRVDGEGASNPVFSAQSVEIGSAKIEAIARSTAPLTISHPMGVRIGDSIEFLGYDLRSPQPLHAGDTLSLILFWRSLKTTGTSYTVFTHLLDSREQVAGQNDSKPANGSRETMAWSPGEVIADEHSFQVNPNAAPGQYRIEVGMYDASTGTRLQVFGADSHPGGDRILLQELIVQ